MPQTLLLTRPTTQATDFWAEVEQACPGKFECIMSPVLEITPEGGSVDLDNVQALLFTSRYGVEQFAQRSDRRDIPALCVGGATARVATAHNFAAQSASGDASALAALAAASYIPDAGHMLHLRGANAAGDIAGSLMAEGIDAAEHIIYDQKPLPLSEDARTALSSQNCIAPVFSPRSAARLRHEINSLNVSKLTVVAISENAARPFADYPGITIKTANLPNNSAMLVCLAAL